MSQKLAMPNENRNVAKTPGHWYWLSWERRYYAQVVKS